MKKEEFVCPKCGEEIEIIHDFDYDSLVAVNYPKCVKCSHTTHEVFHTKEAVKVFLRENGTNW